MRASIITACSESTELLNDTVGSVLAQGMSDIEHVVVGGIACGDDVRHSMDVSNLRWVDQAVDNIAAGMNGGLVMASGNIIGLLNAGDFCYRDTVSEIVERDCALDAFPDSLERMLRGALDARKPASSVLKVMPPKAA